MQLSRCRHSRRPLLLPLYASGGGPYRISFRFVCLSVLVHRSALLCGDALAMVQQPLASVPTIHGERGGKAMVRNTQRRRDSSASSHKRSKNRVSPISMYVYAYTCMGRWTSARSLPLCRSRVFSPPLVRPSLFALLSPRDSIARARRQSRRSRTPHTHAYTCSYVLSKGGQGEEGEGGCTRPAHTHTHRERERKRSRQKITRILCQSGVIGGEGGGGTGDKNGFRTPPHIGHTQTHTQAMWLSCRPSRFFRLLLCHRVSPPLRDVGIHITHSDTYTLLRLSVRHDSQPA